MRITDIAKLIRPELKSEGTEPTKLVDHRLYVRDQVRQAMTAMVLITPDIRDYDDMDNFNNDMLVHTTRYKVMEIICEALLMESEEIQNKIN